MAVLTYKFRFVASPIIAIELAEIHLFLELVMNPGGKELDKL